MRLATVLSRLAAVATLSLGLSVSSAAARPAPHSAGSLIPTRNCDASVTTAFSHPLDLPALNVCRAKLGLGPLRLPSNWASLTAREQIFTVVDLERVSRGLAPVAGLTAELDVDAQRGANADTDPVGDGPFASAWAGSSLRNTDGAGALASDYLWVYDDGAFSQGQGINLDCATQERRFL